MFNVPSHSRDEANNKEVPDRKDTRHTLIVSDDGIGMPENIDFENPETLGLQLVNILVDQLNGEIKLKRDKGTGFAIGLSAEEKGNNKKDRPEGYASSEN
ncbi:ATP-binding protein [Methanosarcina sp. UBA411]|uniref:ATP-binding protein n=1 Tax=Methanosarcina sp. UBA411 TaxID=1915589 RepID=UPI0025F9AC9C|nr:ATP-binding protein [Methanosarcina sp. UBA411]